MLTLTRKTDYALVALAGLSREWPDARSARHLAEAFGLPGPALRNILKALASAGLLESTPGPRGGYRLARSPERISVLDVAEAIDGPVRLATCCRESDSRACQVGEPCPIRHQVYRLHDRLLGELERATIASLAMEPGVVLTASGHELATRPAVRAG